MRISDLFPILTEAPLPDTWDKTKFNPDDIDDLVQYITTVARPSGMGSSRIAFDFKYRGMRTTVKVAHTQKGIRQNAEEINVLSKPSIKNSGVVIPMVDFDRQNGNRPLWIQTMTAAKATRKLLRRYFHGIDLPDVIAYANGFARGNHMQVAGGSSGLGQFYGASALNQLQNNQQFGRLVKLLIDNPNTNLWELEGAENWGFYDQRPVIIDIGGNGEVETKIDIDKIIKSMK